jgi:hypothetical protein
MSVNDELRPVSLDHLGLPLLSVIGLKGLPLLNVAEIDRQIRATPYPPPPPGPAPYREGAKNGFSEKRPGRKTQNILESENPVKGKRRKPKSEIFSGSETLSGRNALPPDPPEWIFDAEESPGLELRQRYAPIPARALLDRRVRGVSLLVLGGLAAHASRLGITYVGQNRLAALLRISQPQVSRAIRKLVEFDYVVKLVPCGRRRPGAWARGNRYFVKVVPDAVPPPKETVWPGRK